MARVVCEVPDDLVLGGDGGCCFNGSNNCNGYNGCEGMCEPMSCSSPMSVPCSSPMSMPCSPPMSMPCYPSYNCCYPPPKSPAPRPKLKTPTCKSDVDVYCSYGRAKAQKTVFVPKCSLFGAPKSISFVEDNYLPCPPPLSPWCPVRSTCYN
ncbi:putative small proline-rich protein 5 [Teleopsis dalmanni]|uniref:putative small proline-rich protein 5 n=1 Tax=Teleopsis dalmanni TaxID=139649 RepID=UPI0018CE7FAE|nr:putative small proline-rich protein 5 [Teleopsis dalmanni]